MKRKKGFRRALCGAAGAAAVLLLTQFWYYPHYRSAGKNAEIAPPLTPGAEICALSANVRCYSPTDLFRRSWFYRADLLVKTLAAEQPDVIGFQEVTPVHRRYLDAALPGYACVLQYRDRQLLAESCPIYYSRSRFEAEGSGSFWLSETPDVMSRHAGAACYRICSYVTLLDRVSGERFTVLNTHLDHISDQARIDGIRVIFEKIDALGLSPCLLMGDLNTGEAGAAYAAVTARFSDAKYLAAQTDGGATFQKFGKAPERENIDYFMVSPAGFDVRQYRVLRAVYNGVYPSDHFPIALRFRLQSPAAGQSADHTD